jgi:NAD-dependent DNA ligase
MVKYSQEFINALIEHPITALNEYNYKTQKKLEKIIIDAKDTYYNAKTTNALKIPDATFDTLIDILEEKYPKSKVLAVIGSNLPTDATNKTKLPYHLGSMDKIKPGSRKFDIWTDKYNSGKYQISEKLDGLSGLLVLNLDETSDTPNKIVSKLYTRGNGDVGQDITHLLPFLKFNLDSNDTLASKYKLIARYMKKDRLDTIAIRGEIIVSKSMFEKKYSKQFPKGRSLVAGVVNSKADGFNKPELRNRAKDLEFVSYQLVFPEYSAKDQFKILYQDLKMRVAYNKYLDKELTIDICKELLLEFKKESNYEIDGIIITDTSKVYPNPTSGNPKHSVAFKMALDEQAQETVIEYVEYNVSKNGVLKPRIKYHPIEIGGDTFNYTTGFNARYIKDNNLGPGSRISIIKSGDVIPYILKVLSPSIKGEWQQPEKKWHWNDNEVEAIIDDNTDLPMEKVMLQFFNQFEIDGMKEGVINRLIDAGFNTLNDIFRLSVEALLDIEGFQIKSSTKLIKQIHEKILTPEHSIEKLMVASNCFPHFGIKKMRMITLYFTPKEILDGKLEVHQLVEIDGMGEISATDFLNNLPSFLNWLSEHPKLKIKMTKNKPFTSPDKASQHPFVSGKKICFTGFRDKVLQSFVESNGGSIATSVSKNTSYVVAKDINEGSSKLSKAQSLGIKVISLDYFKSKIGK